MVRDPGAADQREELEGRRLIFRHYQVNSRARREKSLDLEPQLAIREEMSFPKVARVSTNSEPLWLINISLSSETWWLV